MKSIIEYIAKETHGKVYKSHRFCFDREVPLPSLTYDDNQAFTIRNDRYGETAPKKTTTSLENLAKSLQKHEKPIFSFFLDGSRRIYKVDDIEYQKRIFPIVGGQIGVACCQRKSSDVFEKAILEKHLVLSVPSAAYLGQHHDLELNRLVKEINASERLKRMGLDLSSIMKYPANKSDNADKEKYFDLGTQEIQQMMVECEKKVVDKLVKKNLLNEDCYLIKDGSLQYPVATKGDFKELAKYKANYRRVIGVSKSFNPEFSKDKQGRSNAAAIANLPLYHRTPAVVFQENRVGNVFFSVWYVRIRDAKVTDSPFSGIVKIEKILVSPHEIEYGLDSGEVDRITANIINERNPVCYGKDQRWANHLYPIYLTESYLKSQYLSDLHFINLF